MLWGWCLNVVIILKLASWCAADMAVDCGMDEKLEQDKCVPCPQCSVGTGLAEPCGFGNGGGLTCQPCPEGFYNDEPTGNMCKPCTECEYYKRDYRHRCRSVVDAECGECLDGFRDDDKNLAHREPLYPCKRCENGICDVSAPSDEASDAGRERHMLIWLPVIIVTLLIVICCGLAIGKWKISFCNFCGVLGVCLKRNSQVFRPIPPRKSDEEDLYGVSRDVNGTDEVQRWQGCAESEPCDTGSAERSDGEGLLEEVFPVNDPGGSIRNNTYEEIHKSTENKLQAIPPPSDQTNFTTPPGSTLPPNGRRNGSAQAINNVESGPLNHDPEVMPSHSFDQRTTEWSELGLQATSQDSLSDLDDDHSESVHSEASTRLIRGDQSPSGSPAPGDQRNIVPGINHSLSDPVPTTLTTSESFSPDGSIQTTKGPTRESRKTNLGMNGHSGSRRPSSQSPLPDQSAHSKDKLSSSATGESLSEGHPRLILEFKARVVLTQAESKQSRNIPTTSSQETVSSMNSIPFIGDDNDDDETSVKRPFAGPMFVQYSSATCRGCRPRNDQVSVPSFHFPIQETCGRVSVSGSSNE